MKRNCEMRKMEKIKVVLNYLSKRNVALKGPRRDDLGEYGEWIEQTLEKDKSETWIRNKLIRSEELLEGVFTYISEK